MGAGRRLRSGTRMSGPDLWRNPRNASVLFRGDLSASDIGLRSGRPFRRARGIESLSVGVAVEGWPLACACAPHRRCRGDGRSTVHDVLSRADRGVRLARRSAADPSAPYGATLSGAADRNDLGCLASSGLLLVGDGFRRLEFLSVSGRRHHYGGSGNAELQTLGRWVAWPIAEQRRLQARDAPLSEVFGLMVDRNGIILSSRISISVTGRQPRCRRCRLSRQR